jgi:hypothetical protein
MYLIYFLNFVYAQQDETNQIIYVSALIHTRVRGVSLMKAKGLQ